MLGKKVEKVMKFLVITCKVLGYVWLIISVLLIVTGIVGVWMKDGFFRSSGSFKSVQFD